MRELAFVDVKNLYDQRNTNNSLESLTSCSKYEDKQ